MGSAAVKEELEITEQTRPKFLVSSVGLLWPLLSLRYGARVARTIGFEGFQASPSRGIRLDDATDYVKALHHLFPIYLREGSLIKRGGKPDLLSRLVFSSAFESEIRDIALSQVPGTQRVVHHLSEACGNDLIEAHPGIGLSPFEFRVWAIRNGFKIAFDTCHCRTGKAMTGPTNAEELWADWLSYLGLLAKLVKVIHFQPKRDGGKELVLWLLGRPTELHRILVELGINHPDIEYWVVELFPPIDPKPDQGWKKIPWAAWTGFKLALWVVFSPLIHWLVLRKLKRSTSW